MTVVDGVGVGAGDAVGGEEPPARGPRIGLGDGARKLGDRAGMRVAAKEERQHRHEVALAASEAAVQVRALAGVLADRAPDQRQPVFEAAHELWGYHVVGQGPRGVRHPLRQPQNVVSLVDALGQIEDVGDGRHGLGAPARIARSYRAIMSGPFHAGADDDLVLSGPNRLTSHALTCRFNSSRWDHTIRCASCRAWVLLQ